MLFGKCFLNRVQVPVLVQTLDRQNLTAVQLCRKHQTGIDGTTINHNGTGPAFSNTTALLGPL